jgi:lysophospholipase L1-like esterase
MRIRPVRASSIVSLTLTGVLTAAVVVVSQAMGGASQAGTPAGNEPDHGAHWVDTWVSMPQLTEPANLPPAPFTTDGLVLANATLRQTIHVSVGGQHLRLRFSNAFGGAALPITAVTVARPLGGAAGVSAIEPGSTKQITFHGQQSVVIPVGAQYVSDPFDFPVAAQSNLTVTTFLATGQASNNITSHPGSRTSTYFVSGNHVADQDLPGAVNAAHWYFLSGAEVLARDDVNGVVMLGDSLTDGRGSTTNGNDRWPDQLLARLQSRHETSDIAVLNEAAGGNRILNDGLGPNGLGRIDRDVLAQSGINWLLVFEGVNDIGTADATPAAQAQVVSDLIAAFDQIIIRTHAQGIKVYGATITPFGGNTGYDDPAGLREASRQQVNDWIRTSHEFDAVIDFDKAVRDPAAPRNINPTLDVGDHLHFNPTGYKVIADTVPARLFR